MYTNKNIETEQPEPIVWECVWCSNTFLDLDECCSDDFPEIDTTERQTINWRGEYSNVCEPCYDDEARHCEDCEETLNANADRYDFVNDRLVCSGCLEYSYQWCDRRCPSR